MIRLSGRVLDSQAFFFSGSTTTLLGTHLRPQSRECGPVSVASVGPAFSQKNGKAGSVRTNAVLSLRGSAESGDKESAFVKCTKLKDSFHAVWEKMYGNSDDVYGNSVEGSYVDALKAFVLDTISLYNEGFSMSALGLELNMNDGLSSADNPYDLSHLLSREEQNTRRLWLLIIYSTLARLNHVAKGGNTPPPPDDWSEIKPLINFTCNMIDDGFSFERLKLEMSLKHKPGFLTPTQLQMRSQWIRIVYLTNEAIHPTKHNY
eukprot:CAMPEP_0181288956 /NCGR_PEP_ID=MMETSP1101-20121128/625_1 /TAXON_ID=46948 /ORGANISM="Rhodomonas abbreviata, Strain Caron Lab Isolate" /LENGTH=261 /DNA_ID=CAMNT_0023393145 /DNA_START=141 /DNA_END=926 /DNA_ORIENTATION=+